MAGKKRPEHVGDSAVLASEDGVAMRVVKGAATPIAVAEVRYVDDDGKTEVVHLTVKQVVLLKQLLSSGLFGLSLGEVLVELATQRMRRMAGEGWFE